MVCIDCKCNLKTVDTANFDGVVATYRRKKCPKCGRTYYTKELIMSDDEGRKKFRVKAHEYYEKTL